VLMAMPVIVLLVACLNLADLLLARGHVRRQELAVRASLGGSRGRLTRQLLTEGVLLSLIGGVVGLWLSTWATGALLRALQPLLPAVVVLPSITVDWRVLAGTMAFSVLASLIFGVWPAWALTGSAVVADLKRHVGEGGRQPGGIRVGNALVVAQVALSIVLLASAGLFLKSALAATSVDPGFRLEDGVLAEVDPSLAGYDDEEARTFHLALLERVRTLPGVDAATLGSSFPFNSFNDSRNVAPAGRTNRVDSVFTVIGRDYARTLGLPMLAGRDFTEGELTSADGERVAIIDDALAQRLWPEASAVGQMVQFMDDQGAAAVGPPLRVVGVMRAVKHSIGTPTAFPHVYVPLGHHDDIEGMTLQLRLAGAQDERAMLTTLARLVREADERVPVLALKTWRDSIDSGVEILIFGVGARVCAIFGAIALLLAVIGVYGVKSYVVSRRTREFGIRIATGADPRALLWQVLREGSRVTGAGIVLGLVLAVGAGQLLQGILYGVNAVEPIVLLTAPLVLLAASLLASLVPARRATRVDPTIALRAE
jgi:putative ABC transport system permease protein